MTTKVNTVTVERVMSVDQSRVDFGQLAVGTKAEVKTREGLSPDQKYIP